MCLLFFFSTIQMTAGLCCRGVRGVYEAVERRHAAPAVVGRLGLVLDTELGFWASGRTDDGRMDGRTKAGFPPNPPGSSNRKPQRNSDLDFPLFAVYHSGVPCIIPLKPHKSVAGPLSHRRPLPPAPVPHPIARALFFPPRSLPQAFRKMDAALLPVHGLPVLFYLANTAGRAQSVSS